MFDYLLRLFAKIRIVTVRPHFFNQGNFVRLPDGTIHAIDLVICQAPVEIKLATRGGE